MKREVKFSLVFRDMWQSAGKYVPRVDQLVKVAPGDKNNTAAVHTASNVLIPLFNVFPEKIDFFTFSLLSHPLHIFCALYLYYNLRTTSAFFILPGLPAASGKKRL